MIKACELTRSSVVEIDGVPHRVETITVQSPSARGGATLYKVRFRNIKTRNKVDMSLKGEDPFREADFETREVQFLFRDLSTFTFMDVEDFSQFELQEADVAEVANYLVENMEGIKALVTDGKVLCLNLPDTVALEIVECDPSIRGASATARTKPAKLSTGLIVQVPEYISQGEIIRVDTRTDSFIARA